MGCIPSLQEVEHDTTSMITLALDKIVAYLIQAGHLSQDKKMDDYSSFKRENIQVLSKPRT